MLRNSVVLFTFVLALAQQSGSLSCGGFNSSTDWLIQPCSVASELLVTTNSSYTVYTIRNGIVARTLVLSAATQLLGTWSIRSEASGGEKLRAVVPEADLEINGVRVLVGGNSTAGTSLRAKFAEHSVSTPVAGNFTFMPGSRGSRVGKAWPPKGIRVEFVHTISCSSLSRHAALNGMNAIVNITIIYELYDGTSAFGKHVALQHTCPFPLYVFNMSVSVLALARDRFVETFTDASISEGAITHLDDAPGFDVWINRFLPIAASHAYDKQVPAFGPGLSSFGTGDSFMSYLCVEVVHDAVWGDTATHGMSRFGLESSRMWRTLAPQTEQFPLTGNAMCVGGQDLPADDPRKDGWCYDGPGTAGLQAYIDQAAQAGFEMVDISLNMKNTWRSQVGVEFQSAANISWFKALVDRARSQHLELGAYQLLRNARSATAINQCAPDNAATLPNDGFDDMDLLPPMGTGRPCHNGGNPGCNGGPGCCSMCSATEFYDAMEASVFAFWDATGMTVTEQDGAESDSPCANVSHVHHHGLNDSVWVKWQAVHRTFKGYLSRGGFVQGMPGHWLEGGQSKVPGGYDEMTWSLPRWTWIARQRERMIADPQLRDMTEPNALRYFCAPFTPYHPQQVLPGDNKWSPVAGLESTATLEPLEDHTLELAWTLSQSFGTGIFVNFRGSRLFGGPKSQAVVEKWVHFFKQYRQVLGSDFVTINVGTRCWGTGATTPTSSCTITDWDGILHRTPIGFYPDIQERGLAMAWNQMNVSLAVNITLPLYYSGLAPLTQVRVRQEEGPSVTLVLDANCSAMFPATLQPMGITYFVVTL